ncbi:TetR/AcrR family transcriptional regulator [Rudaeicoccus suwonensis]|uniref:TetR family transcriptional regulator n=1 Tax=Rudaeicoccus suwonensis TaxID=657409 RepID=A0A561E7W8_9MICO|nr:TetR/AcrR family transcriptional regulator [Rudaeicoccus suwonensis]TWE11660.1 TetR family transcriptional regulator [Rudaeicoccus suwonensis]
MSAITDWRRYPDADLPPILQASLAEFVEHGYDGTSVRNIAGRLGVTVPALYYHYENKQALLVALLERAMDLVDSHTRAAADEAGADPVARLAAIVEAIALYMAQHAKLAFLHSELRSLTDEHRARYVARRDALESLLRDCLEQGLRSGEFSTPWVADCARAILSMCQGIAGWYDPHGADDPSAIARRHVQLSLSMMGASATGMSVTASEGAHQG